jgi:hypothetical protein
MTYFKDLSDYGYLPDRHSGITTIGWIGLRPEDPLSPPRVKSIGWLAHDHPFPKQVPSEEILDLLWDYCSISVNQSRGLHPCEFCPESKQYWRVDVVRNGKRKLLGSAEICIFGRDANVYAAPTLLYHYVSVHHCKPPDEFIHAVKNGPRPPTPE